MEGIAGIAEKTRMEELVSCEDRASSGSNIPIVHSEPSWFGPSFVILLQIATMTLIIMAATGRIWFAKSPNSNLNNSTVPRDTRVIYTTGLAILASLITSYTKGQVETLWLRKTLVSLEQYDVPTSVRSKASVLVGQGRFIDQVKRWHIVATYTIVGLVTSAIVAGLSISSATCK
jgi:hypothetical protein